MTTTDIANGALIKIGAALITSLDDDVKAAQVAKNRFDICRRACLRMHPWNFAIKRVVLSPLSETPAFDWAYGFLLPSDCLRIWKVNETDEEYRVEGRNILIDSEELRLRYIFDCTTVNEWDSLFCEICSLYLAWDICYAITQSNSLKEQLWADMRNLLPMAKFADATEEVGDSMQANEFLDSRLSSTGGFVRDPGT